MRRILIFLMVALIALAAGAADIDFKIGIGDISLNPVPDARTEARLAQWNDPMGRLLFHFNQQQSWQMRGTMPGTDRASGAAVKLKLQSGVPVQVLAADVQAGIDLHSEPIEVVRWPWEDDESPDVMSLEQQLSVLLGQRLQAK